MPKVQDYKSKYTVNCSKPYVTTNSKTHLHRLCWTYHPSCHVSSQSEREWMVNNRKLDNWWMRQVLCLRVFMHRWTFLCSSRTTPWWLNHSISAAPFSSVTSCKWWLAPLSNVISFRYPYSVRLCLLLLSACRHLQIDPSLSVRCWARLKPPLDLTVQRQRDDRVSIDRISHPQSHFN